MDIVVVREVNIMVGVDVGTNDVEVAASVSGVVVVPVFVPITGAVVVGAVVLVEVVDTEVVGPFEVDNVRVGGGAV